MTVARASTWLVVDSKAPLEKRIEALEQNLRQLKDSFEHARTALKKEVGELVTRVEKEQRERVEAQEDVSRKLEEVAVGGLHIEAVGLTWLLIGVVFATLPGEAGRLLTALGFL